MVGLCNFWMARYILLFLGGDCISLRAMFCVGSIPKIKQVEAEILLPAHCRGVEHPMGREVYHGIQSHEAPAVHGTAGTQLVRVCSSLRLIVCMLKTVMWKWKRKQKRKRWLGPFWVEAEVEAVERNHLSFRFLLPLPCKYFEANSRKKLADF